MFSTPCRGQGGTQPDYCFSVLWLLLSSKHTSLWNPALSQRLTHLLTSQKEILCFICFQQPVRWHTQHQHTGHWGSTDCLFTDWFKKHRQMHEQKPSLFLPKIMCRPGYFTGLWNSKTGCDYADYTPTFALKYIWIFLCFSFELLLHMNHGPSCAVQCATVTFYAFFNMFYSYFRKKVKGSKNMKFLWINCTKYTDIQRFS